jgi:hypothetical protein
MAGMPSATPQAVDLRVPSPKVGAAVELLGTPDLAAAIEQAAAYALPYAGRLTSQFGGAEDWAAQKATVPPPLQKPWSERQADQGFVAFGAVSNVVSNAAERRGWVNDRLEGPDVDGGVGGVVSPLMPDRVVVLRSHDPLSFVADTCAALADAVNEPHVWSPSHGELVAAYAGLVRAYAGLVRPSVQDEVDNRPRARTAGPGRAGGNSHPNGRYRGPPARPAGDRARPVLIERAFQRSGFGAGGAV